MKFNKIIVVFIIILILIAGSVSFVIKPRIVSVNTEVINNSIYIPKGIADKYKDYLKFSFDDDRIWEYELNSEELDMVEADIDNGIWLNPTKRQFDDIIDVFLEHSSYIKKSDDSSENYNGIFYCIYDNTANSFIQNDDGSILGWHRELFIYDKNNKIYTVVFKGI